MILSLSRCQYRLKPLKDQQVEAQVRYQVEVEAEVAAESAGFERQSRSCLQRDPSWMNPGMQSQSQ